MSLSSIADPGAAPQSPALPLADIHLPAAPSLSLSWQGYGVIVFIILVIALLVWALIRYRKKRQLQRVALAQLSTLKPTQTREIATLLKQAALSHFPRQDIAALHGLAWWHFIEQKLPVKKQANVYFSSRSEMLEQALYGQHELSEINQQRFYDDTRYWFTHALPVKRVGSLLSSRSSKGKQHD